MSNNLRDENGALIGGLVVFDYVAGMDDFKNGNPPPDMTSPSYDLGRQRAAEASERDAEFKAWMKREDRRRREGMKSLLSPEAFAEYERQIAALIPAKVDEAG